MFFRSLMFINRVFFTQVSFGIHRLWFPLGCYHTAHQSHARVCGRQTEGVGEWSSQVPDEVSQVLLLVSGEVHPIPQQKCLHFGAFSFLYIWKYLFGLIIFYFMNMSSGYHRRVTRGIASLLLPFLKGFTFYHSSSWVRWFPGNILLC